jgi:hypothetical protein
VAVLSALLLVGAACPKREPARGQPAKAEPAPALAAKEPAHSPLFEAQPEGKRLALLYTASVQGYVTPCGCTAEPLGGVARLAAAVDDAHRAYGERVLFVDAGDLLFEKLDDNLPADACQAESRVELLLGTYAKKGIRATALGPLDDARGAAFRDARLARYDIPTVGVPGSARALVEGARHASGLLVDAGGVKVGLTAFRVDEERETAAARAALEKEAARLVAEGAELVVVLAQAKRSLVPAVAQDLAGVDVVVQGRDPGEVPRPAQQLGAKGPWWVAAGAQAQHLGVVEIVLEGRAKGAALRLDDRQDQAARRAHLLDVRVAQYEAQVKDAEPGERRDFVAGRLEKAKAERARLLADAHEAPPPAGAYLRPRAVGLSRGMPEEEAARAALAAYEEAIPALVSRCEEGITCEEPAAGAATYVGVETCFQCHRGAVQFWQQQFVEAPGKDEEGNDLMRRLSHATAWETLEAKGKDKDRSCVGCHSIGFNEPGGYCRTADVDFRQNVQCESCHGPASLHVQSGGDSAALVGKGVDEAVCRRCHHVPHIPTTESFVFHDKLQHVLGEGHGKARLDELVRAATKR